MQQAPATQTAAERDEAFEARLHRIFFAVMVAFYVIAPLQPLVNIYPVFLMKALCFGLFACAFNLLIGFGGLLSFGHAMFLGMAGYVSAYSAKSWGFTPELAILAGTATATLLGIPTGLLAIRRQGIYFAMITLALAQMVFFFCVQAPFTGGEDGIQGVPRGKLLGLIDLAPTTTMYFFVLAIFLAGFLLIYRIIHSPFGQVLKAIRENEPRAISLGYRTDHYKLVAFVLSAGLSGLAGATKSLVFQLASLTDVHWTMSGEVVLMTLLGGLGTIFGPVVGALVLASMEFYLAEIGSWVTIVQGVIFVVCVLAFRRGILGELEAWLLRRRPGKAAPAAKSIGAGARAVRWIAFLPIGAVLIAIAQVATVTVAQHLAWWISAPLILFFGALMAGAGFLPVRIAPEPKIGCAILLTLFLLFEGLALVSSFPTSPLYPTVMRIYADITIIIGAVIGATIDKSAV